MTLMQLLYAVTIADTKSINKAAEKLFVSQPALSGAIKDLEDEIHINIFIRNNRGIVVTTEGEEFLRYARQMVELNYLINERFIIKNIEKKKRQIHYIKRHDV